MVTLKIENLDTSRPVVMVDDNETDLDIGRRFYAYSGLENPFLTLGSGEALLDYLDRVKREEEPTPVLVLLDVNMPQLSGFDTLQCVREKPEFEEVPIIVMLTNSDNPQDTKRALALGANGYQAKHFDVDGFVSFVTGFFR